MQLIFKTITNIIIFCLVLSTVFHVVLFASDSEVYKQWVTVQIILQIAAVVSLLYVRKFKLIALIFFVVLATTFTYINATYTNYGHLAQHFVLVPIFWVCYLGLVYGLRKKFLKKESEVGSNAA